MIDVKYTSISCKTTFCHFGIPQMHKGVGGVGEARNGSSLMAVVVEIAAKRNTRLFCKCRN